MSDINLLPKSNTVSLQQERAVAFFRRLSIILLSFTAFISVAIFILVIFSPLSKAQQEEKRLITQLAASSNRVGRNVIIQERLNTISNILKTRNAFEEHIGAILTVLPKDVEIDKMSVSVESIVINGKAKRVSDANDFFSKLVEYQEKKEYFKSVSLNIFALQTVTGTYNFVLELTLL